MANNVEKFVVYREVPKELIEDPDAWPEAVEVLWQWGLDEVRGIRAPGPLYWQQLESFLFGHIHSSVGLVPIMIYGSAYRS